MTTIEIFSRIGANMVKGMMTHEQLMKAYSFLGLKGYASCHEYHYLIETKSYISLSKHVSDCLSIVLNTGSVQDVPDIIPKSWFNNTRDKVDSKTRSQAIEEALRTWIEWEESTKSLYEELYSELMTKDLVSAEYVKQLVLDVEEEIIYARNEQLAKSAIGYDIVSILEEQEDVERFFKKKIKKAFKEK